MEKNLSVRYENLDLLRIISMLFVVCIHYVGWGGLSNASDVPMLNFAIGGGIAVACNCAVNCFYMISGFFIRDEESPIVCRKRILKVWIPTIIYSVSIPLILMLCGQITLTFKQGVLLFLPVLSNQYWFSTVFIAVTILLPFIAKLLAQLDNKMLLWLLIVLVCLDSVQPILGFNAFYNNGFGLLHALTMYIIGYTIKRFDFHIKKWKSVIVYLVCVGLIGVIIIISIKMYGDRNRTIADYNSILMILQSVAMFMFFKELTVKKVHFSILSPYIFGIYLLNDNPYARDFLWQKILHCSDYYSKILLPLHLFISVCAFFCVALLIEFARVKIFEHLKIKNRGK